MKKTHFVALIATALLSLSACGGSSTEQSTTADSVQAEQPVWTGKIRFSEQSTLNKADKRVLIISSSPRIGGNTDLLADEFMRGAQEAGGTVEKVNLAKLNITFLNELEADFQSQTPRDDDATMVVQKMAEADIIVLAAPVYYMNIDGMMKTLIDRTFAQGHNRNIAGKEYFYLTACADAEDATAMCAINAFRGFIMCVPGSVERGMVKATGCAVRNGKGLEKYKQQAYALGKQI